MYISKLSINMANFSVQKDLCPKKSRVEITHVIAFTRLSIIYNSGSRYQIIDVFKYVRPSVLEA